MSKRALLIISQHPKVKEYCEEIEARKKQMKEKLGFLQKQADDASKEYDKDHAASMKKIQVYLKEEGIYKGEINDKTHFDYSMKADCLELCTHDGNEHPFSAMLDGIFGRQH